MLESWVKWDETLSIHAAYSRLFRGLLLLVSGIIPLVAVAIFALSAECAPSPQHIEMSDRSAAASASATVLIIGAGKARDSILPAQRPFTDSFLQVAQH